MDLSIFKRGDRGIITETERCNISSKGNGMSVKDRSTDKSIYTKLAYKYNYHNEDSEDKMFSIGGDHPTNSEGDSLYLKIMVFLLRDLCWDYNLRKIIHTVPHTSFKILSFNSKGGKLSIEFTVDQIIMNSDKIFPRTKEVVFENDKVIDIYHSDTIDEFVNGRIKFINVNNIFFRQNTKDHGKIFSRNGNSYIYILFSDTRGNKMIIAYQKYKSKVFYRSYIHERILDSLQDEKAQRMMSIPLIVKKKYRNHGIRRKKLGGFRRRKPNCNIYYPVFSFKVIVNQFIEFIE